MFIKIKSPSDALHRQSDHIEEEKEQKHSIANSSVIRLHIMASRIRSCQK